MILFALGVHIANAALVYALGCMLGLGRRIGLLSGAVYLSLFTHFHAILWPVGAARPLRSVFLVLLGFLLYLKTERRVSEGRPYRALFWATVVVGLLALLSRSALLLPLLVLTHLVLQQDRVRRIGLKWVLVPLAVLGAVGLVPFAVTLSTFLQPIRAAFSLDWSDPFRVLRPALEVSDLLLAAGMIGVFIAVYAARQRQLGVLVAWCAVAAPSQQFVYLSPAFALVFCSGLSFLASVLISGRRRGRVRGLLLLGVVAGLCLENLVAIRLAEWRGKAARLIHADLQQTEKPHPLDRGGLAVSGVAPFDRMHEAALSQLSQGNEEAAGTLFLQAARHRPFLLRFLLPNTCRLEDLRWLTNGIGLGRWLAQIPKHPRIAKVFEKELSDYEACLFYLAYLGDRHGRKEESRYWLSQLYYLEQDPEVLTSRLSQRPRVREEPAVAEFLRSLKQGGLFVDPARWQKDDYSFGRFLGRFLFRWDIASTWDRRFGYLLHVSFDRG